MPNISEKLPSIPNALSIGKTFFQMFGGESPGYKRGAREDMEEHLVSPTDRYFLTFLTYIKCIK